MEGVYAYMLANLSYCLIFSQTLYAFFHFFKGLHVQGAW